MNKNTNKGFIYFRYIFPIVMALLSVILMFIPCYSYITADTGVNDAISLWELMGNSWQTVREYLFGSGTKYDVTIDFARILMALLIVFVVLFVLGVAFSAYCAITAFRYFANDCKESKERILFITLVPNRIVLCIYTALTLPIFFMPMLMPLLYKNYLYYQVQLSVTPFDMVYIALALYIACVIIVAISTQKESMSQMNIFAKRQAPISKLQNEHEETEKAEQETDDPYEIMSRKEKQEQNERILRMLENYKSNTQDKEEDDD